MSHEGRVLPFHFPLSPSELVDDRRVWLDAWSEDACAELTGYEMDPDDPDGLDADGSASRAAPLPGEPAHAFIPEYLPFAEDGGGEALVLDARGALSPVRSCRSTR